MAITRQNLCLSEHCRPARAVLTTRLNVFAPALLSRSRQFDPSCEALCLVGSQEGLAHLLLAVAEPGDGLLLTDCSYPAYLGAARVAGLRPLFLSLGPDALPDFEAVPEEHARLARVLLLNYPCNPTSGERGVGSVVLCRAA